MCGEYGMMEILWTVLYTVLFIFTQYLLCKNIYKLGYRNGGNMVLDQWKDFMKELEDNDKDE